MRVASNLSTEGRASLLSHGGIAFSANGPSVHASIEDHEIAPARVSIFKGVENLFFAGDRVVAIGLTALFSSSTAESPFPTLRHPCSPEILLSGRWGGSPYRALPAVRPIGDR
jgi:hypothetical protein